MMYSEDPKNPSLAAIRKRRKVSAPWWWPAAARQAVYDRQALLFFVDHLARDPRSFPPVGSLVDARYYSVGGERWICEEIGTLTYIPLSRRRSVRHTDLPGIEDAYGPFIPAPSADVW